MVNKCVVPKCRGNYDINNKVAVFKFPDDEKLKQKWLRAIRRDNFKPTQYSKVCELHFQPHDIRRATVIRCDDGEEINHPLKVPQLLPGSVPSILPICPAYLTKSNISKTVRESPQEKRLCREHRNLRCIIEESVKSFEAHRTRTMFSTLAELKARLEFVDISRVWTVIIKDNSVLFLKIQFTQAPCISYSVVIDDKLKVKVYFRENCIKRIGVKIVPESVTNVEEISDILKSLEFYNHPPTRKSDTSATLTLVSDILCNADFQDSPYEKSVNFVIEQLKLLLCKMVTSVEDQQYPVQIKEEPQEEQDVDENGPQEEKKEPFIYLEEEQQEGTEENEEEEVKRPVAVNLPVKVEQEQEEEEEEEELAPPVAVFLMSKEEPKEEDEEEVGDPSCFADASGKKEEISETSGRMSAVEDTSSDSQALVRSSIGQHRREETYHCSICQKSISKERWTGHMKIHSGEKNYQCSVCQKRFSEKVTLDVHMRIHTREKRHICSVCQTSFTQSGSLARHKCIHSGERPYTCSICERNFYNKSNLNTHMLSHTGEKKHHCSVCQRSFSLKKNLVKHALVHTGERPYPCSVCGKGFIQRGSLVEHMRTHTGESSIHHCSICQKSFTQRGNLNVHMLTHTGERPHSCTICHKSFNQGGNLVRHMRTHTGEKPQIALSA